MGFIFNLGMNELIIILVILLLLFGARKLPELARGLGQSISALKRGSSESRLDDGRQTTSAAQAKEVETHS